MRRDSKFEQACVYVLIILMFIALFIPMDNSKTSRKWVYDRYGATHLKDTKINKEVLITSNPTIRAIINTLRDNGVIVYLIHENTINAYTNGKDIYVYDGLYKKISADALAIVLLHETGHIANNHIEKTNTLYENYIMKCMETHDEDTCMTLLMIDPDILEYSRKCEYEADMFAFKVYREAKLPVSACRELFRVLGSGNHSQIETTHPASYKRQEQCVEYIRNGIEVYSPTYETKLTMPAGI